ncbi:predicted protein [Histoplasma capsulatum G186AR]|uniref:Uncharacterized protein n=1 Tax=Ajellomyces capsulatus (strain G186AR / H82 / ATCC MYA-2454 / RMSCC 2432) TaxID=447093 RepID=C0P0C7_AJECG|nr:uncharacterized protein HCBG_08846 [Histoplasma capsulatum G186AR]EEH02943.1 predicted protein [Histoplasma capsulatum G186AR]
MSQHATPADGEKSVGPMKARRGGINLGGRQKLSRSELLRHPGTIRFAPYSAHHRKVPSMDTFNTTIQQTLEAPGMWNGVSTNQPNADAQSEPLRNFSPEPDLDETPQSSNFQYGEEYRDNNNHNTCIKNIKHPFSFTRGKYFSGFNINFTK